MLIADDALSRIDTIRHGFFSREGGVSDGIYASLNCGFGSHDLAENVAANRARAMARLGLAADVLVNVYQVHGSDVSVVDAAPRSNSPKADALVTRTPGVALGILTADCAPVLFADPGAGVIGAAHAGWRGAIGGVLDETIAAMERLGARREAMTAAVGPCIAQASYQVGPEFPIPFREQDPDNDRFFKSEIDEPDPAGRFRFDLEGYVVSRLEVLALDVVSASGTDTCPAESPFFSYRRSCQNGEPDYGRCLSAISLEP